MILLYKSLKLDKEQLLKQRTIVWITAKRMDEKYTYRLQQLTAAAGFSTQPIIVRVIGFQHSAHPAKGNSSIILGP
jgi:hypothetical protein